MKNALLRRKTRRPHNQPSSATTWQSTWLLLAVVAIALCELLNRQEFITHRHLSDIGDWIVQAVVHAIVNGGTWTVVQLRKYTANELAGTIVLLRAGHATQRRFARFLSLSKGQGFRFARFLSLPPVVPTDTTTNTPVTSTAKQRRTRVRPKRTGKTSTVPTTPVGARPTEGADHASQDPSPNSTLPTVVSAFLATMVGGMAYGATVCTIHVENFCRLWFGC